jgi:aminopeptidase N
MENVGLITLRDNYIFRAPPTLYNKAQIAHMHVHELAHMWFGNLVTMKWWNDLWLNESFADFVSYYAMKCDFTDIFPA